jgi:ribosomal protein L7Ae-like RNA K-turn-binding protein
MDDRLLGLLGLARRAGRITHGYDAVLREIAARKAALVLLSADASARTAEKMRRACQENGTRIVTLKQTMEQVGKAIGAKETAVAALTDRSFADRAAALAGQIREDDTEHDD